jgi:hypothetical protein
VRDAVAITRDNAMSLTFRAHFDGKVIVPDEPVDLPTGQSLDVTLQPSADASSSNSQTSIEQRLQALERITGRIRGVAIPDEALRRENLYDERW